MLPYVFVLDLHLMSADELNEMLSVLNSYDRELPPQLEKLRGAMLELRNKQEKLEDTRAGFVEEWRRGPEALDATRQALSEVAQNPTCEGGYHDIDSCPVCREQQ